MAELEYVEVRGRFALIAGDSELDADFNPDVRWCDAGVIRFTPLLSSMSILASPDGPFKVGNAMVEAGVDANGRLSYKGNPFVRLVDLGAATITPAIPRSIISYRVDFLGLASQGIEVRIPSFSFHPLPNVVNDLMSFAPLPVRMW